MEIKYSSFSGLRNTTLLAELSCGHSLPIAELNYIVDLHFYQVRLCVMSNCIPTTFKRNSQLHHSIDKDTKDINNKDQYVFTSCPICSKNIPEDIIVYVKQVRCSDCNDIKNELVRSCLVCSQKLCKLCPNTKEFNNAGYCLEHFNTKIYRRIIQLLLNKTILNEDCNWHILQYI